MDPYKPVALISTPWPLYSRPSIQLATLKAFLQHAHPELPVDAYHFYLQAAAAIGYQTYHDISERTWLAESVYAAMLQPERIGEIRALFSRRVKKSSALGRLDFDDLVGRIANTSSAFLESVSWRRYSLIGFSVCLCQLTSALYFIQRIKKAAPSVPVVIGGSFLAGETIIPLLKQFPQIDFAVHGEGELPLRHLVNELQDGRKPKAVRPAPGLVNRHASSGSIPPARSQLSDLGDLPLPDYEDYFLSLKSLDPERRFFPMLSVEMSRGCWWLKTVAGTDCSGCAFCNLNLQWEGYRYKQPPQVVREIEDLTQRHQTLSVAFMDNLIPLKTAAPVFEQLAVSGKDYRLFCEIRAGVSRSVLKKMKQAGVVELQIGIEALSTGLLKKLNKGTTAMENLQIMKLCEELGLINASNLILGFPGSSRQDVEETLRNLEFALPFRPMRTVEFWLGLGSPVSQHPRHFNVRAVFNHPNWSTLLPPEVSKHVPLIIQSYRGDRTIQKRLWQPVRGAVAQWKKTYEALFCRPQAEPILSYRDGKTFLIIRQRRLSGKPQTHRLAGTSRQIYLLCEKPRSLAELSSAFPTFGEDQLRSFLKMLVRKKLMFTENGLYLSLAIPARTRLFDTASSATN